MSTTILKRRESVKRDLGSLGNRRNSLKNDIGKTRISEETLNSKKSERPLSARNKSKHDGDNKTILKLPSIQETSAYKTDDRYTSLVRNVYGDNSCCSFGFNRFEESREHSPLNNRAIGNVHGGTSDTEDERDSDVMKREDHAAHIIHSNLFDFSGQFQRQNVFYNLSCNKSHDTAEDLAKDLTETNTAAKEECSIEEQPGDDNQNRESYDSDIYNGDNIQDQEQHSEVTSDVDGSEASDALLEPEEKPESEFDFDAEIEPVETYDLKNFDFEHLTKRKMETITAQQMDYKAYCNHLKVLPNGHILRHLNSPYMNLCGHSLGTTRIKALCSALLLNPMVSALEISEDNFDLSSMQFLVETFQDNSTVEQLYLSDNKMGRLPVKLLVEFLTTSDQLTLLSLSGNNLGDQDGDILVGYITATQNLTALDLSYNKFQLEAADLLGKALMRNNTIATLSLRWNHMSGEAMRAFLTCLVKNRSLVNLDLSWNGFNDESIKTLCKALRVNDVLTTLEICSCHITGAQIRQIVGTLKKNVALRNLAVVGNIFSCVDVQTTLQDLVSLKGQINLREFDFGDTPLLPTVQLLVERLMDEKEVMVYHGPIIGRYESKVTDADLLSKINPVTVLVEFGNLLKMSIQELFDYMDKDGGGSLTREEIMQGLLDFDIPLPERSLNLLIKRLDRDGDGEISYQELIEVGQITTKKRIADILDAKRMKASQRETENSRCRKILKRMLAEREAKKIQEEKEEEQRLEAERLEAELAATAAEEEEEEEGKQEQQQQQQQQQPRVVKLPPIEENNKVGH